MCLTPPDTVLNICKGLLVQFAGGRVVEQVSAYREPHVVESPRGNLPDVLFCDESKCVFKFMSVKGWLARNSYWDSQPPKFIPL